jgi:hypothetical protein
MEEGGDPENDPFESDKSDGSLLAKIEVLALARKETTTK